MAIKVIHSLHLNKDMLSISWEVGHEYTWLQNTKIGFVQDRSIITN